MRRIVFFAMLALAGLLPAAGATAQSAADKAMAQRIGSVLKESGQLRDYRVGVKFQDGVAWLTGTVVDSQQGDTAEQLARQVPGVTHVILQLQYTGSPLPPRNDAVAVRNAFSNVDPSRGESSLPVGYVQAYQDSSAQQIQPVEMPRQPMQQVSQNVGIPRTMPRNNMARSMSPRSNMPRPMQRTANGGPPIRQASAQGVYQAGGACCPPGGPGAGGPAAMGGGMGGGMPGGMGGGMGAVPVGFVPHGSGRGPSYDNAQMPGYAWPSYASYPNYAALTYPQQYSPTAWPYIGPFYPYPQVPLAWRKVALEWDDGWWFLDFSAHNSSH